MNRHKQALKRLLRARNEMLEAWKNVPDRSAVILIHTAGKATNDAIRRLVYLVPNSELTVLNDAERFQILGMAPLTAAKIENPEVRA